MGQNVKQIPGDMLWILICTFWLLEIEASLYFMTIQPWNDDKN